MKLILTSVFAFCLTFTVAQVNVVPYAGLNSTRMYQFGYQKGGSFGIIGLDVELRKKQTVHKPVYATLVTGVSYLKNGFYKSTNFGFSTFFYTASITDRQMEYVQIPVVLRVNWQPFPLVEDWKLFLGVGLSNNLLMSASLSEKYTSVLSTDILAPPVTELYEDQRDVTDLGKKSSLFTRFEFGMIYKRVQVSLRYSKSITDLYYQGLENSWKVPASDSEYLKANADDGGIFEKYSEVIIGYRIFR